MTLRVIIADGERPHRLRIRRLLELRSGYTVVADADSGPAVVDAVQRHRPDLLFLDLQMPGCGGIEALRTLDPAVRPVVVFSTGFDQMALSALEASSVGYLLKPYSDHRFEEAIVRAESAITGEWRELWEGRLRGLLGASVDDRPVPLERFAVRDHDRVVMMPASEVDWIEAAADYVRLHRGDDSFQVRMTMQAVEQRLDPAIFLRVHRSHIVRVDRVVSIHTPVHGEEVLVLRGQTRVRVGRTYRQTVRARLGRAGSPSREGRGIFPAASGA